MGYQLELGTIKAHKTGNRIFSYYASEEDERESGLGRIFILVEIVSKDKELSAFASELIAVLKDNFYHSPSSNIESSLELACQKANKYFFGEPKDPFKLYSKLSCLIFAIHEDQISVAHVNNGSLLLVRKTKINHITERQPVKTEKQEKPKLFGSITSGVLDAGDTLVAATRPLTDFFSEEKTISILKQLKTSGAALAFANDIQNIPSTIGFEGILVRISRKTQESPSIVASRQIEHATVESSMKDLRRLEHKTGKLLSLSAWNSMKKKASGALESLSLPSPHMFSGMKNFLTIKREKELPKTSNSSDRSILPAKLPQEVFRRPFERIRSLFQSKNRYLGIGIVLLVLFIATTLVQTKSLSFSSPNKAFLKAAQDALMQAETSLIYQNEQNAREQLQSAKTSLEASGNKINDETRQISKQIDELERRLYSLLDARPEMLIDFSKKSDGSPSGLVAKSLFLSQGRLYSFTNTPFRVLETNLANNTFTQIELDSSLSSLEAVELSADSTGIFASDKSSIHYFSLKEKKSLLSISFPVIHSVSYAERLYAISGDQIYRIDKQKTQLSRSAWITDSTAVAGAKSIAIDGDVYVGIDGMILKYTKGQRQSFSLPLLGTNISADALVTSLESTYLFILDQNLKRVVIVEKSSGKLVKQLALIDLPTPPTSFVVDEVKKVIYLHAGNAIWKISY